jgi:hypothetical protein
MYENMLDVAKTVLQKNPQNYILMLEKRKREHKSVRSHLKKLKKEEQRKSVVNKRNETLARRNQ